MQFCPTCSNFLLVANTGGGGFSFFCQTCPYVHAIVKRVSRKVVLPRKVVDDVLGGEEAWKNVDQTEADCEKCGHNRAFYMQIQTRSADEPSTIFYKCSNFDCGHRWKEG